MGAGATGSKNPRPCPCAAARRRWGGDRRCGWNRGRRGRGTTSTAPQAAWPRRCCGCGTARCPSSRALPACARPARRCPSVCSTPTLQPGLLNLQCCTPTRVPGRTSACESLGQARGGVLFWRKPWQDALDGKAWVPSIIIVQLPYICACNSGCPTRGALPCAGATSATDPRRLLPVAPGPELLHCLLAISHATEPERISRENVAGFLYVKDVEREQQTLVCLAPCNGALPGKLLLASNFKIQQFE